MDADRIAVRGYGEARARPDAAELSLAITAVDAAPDAAAADVAARRDALAGALDELGTPDAARTTEDLAVREEREWERDRWVHRGFRATTRIVLRLTETQRVGPLISAAIERAGAQVSGPRWHVAPENPARLEACERAAADARRRAEAYLAGLGERLGPVFGLSEPATRLRGEVDGAARLAAAAAAEGTGGELGVEAGELTITASIDVSFRIERRAPERARPGFA